MGRYADAISSFDVVISQKTDHAEAHYHRSCALSELNRLEEALAAMVMGFRMIRFLTDNKIKGTDGICVASHVEQN